MADETLLAEVRRRVADLGYELVEFRKAGPAQHLALQVRIDRPDSRPGAGVTAEDCTRVSRALERYLEDTGVVGPTYQLQVSSPGIERPVRFPEHWRRYAGRTVKLTARGVAGHPAAVILDLPDERHVLLRLPDGTERQVALEDVKEALLQDEQATVTGPAAKGRRRP